nr:DUF6514 family protein [uncultured Dysosmobacter sp.]
MEIEKNITATLEREMNKRGLNCVKLSEAIDFPRTTLQGYLKGTSHPRADSMEELASKLGLSVAELISGEEYPTPIGSSGFDQIFSEILELHPLILPVAQQAALLLKTIFQVSETLYSTERPTDAALCQDAVYRYCLHELWDPFRRTVSYGILVKACTQGNWSTSALIAPFSSDRSAVLDLIDRCTSLQLSPEHLLDVVQDFLTQQDLDP